MNLFTTIKNLFRPTLLKLEITSFPDNWDEKDKIFYTTQSIRIENELLIIYDILQGKQSFNVDCHQFKITRIKGLYDNEPTHNP